MTESTPSELLGEWELDPTEEAARGRFGNIVLEFREDGSLIYMIEGDDKNQVMHLRYRIENGELVTDQPSSPREERTRFGLTEGGRLFLEYNHERSYYVRRANAAGASGTNRRVGSSS